MSKVIRPAIITAMAIILGYSFQFMTIPLAMFGLFAFIVTSILVAKA